MKILELTRSFYPSIGGMEKFVSDRLKIYESLGYDYQVITTTHSEKKLSSTKRLPDVTYLPSYTPYEIVLGIKKIIAKDYDVLSVNQVGYFYADYAIRLASKQKKKIILTPHFYFHTNRYTFLKSIHFNYILPKLLEKIDKMICFTKHEANFWIKNFPFLEEKIKIIPHFFLFTQIPKNNYSVEFDKFIFFLGRAEKNKRIDLLLLAFSKIKTDYHLILSIGNNEIPTTLQKKIQDNKKIHFLGKISESWKQVYLANCEALILPTDYEAFGIVNFEASFYKKPLLLSNLEVFKEILYEKGVIYFNNNLQSITESLKYFIELSEKEKKIMGENNFSHLQKYSFEEIKKKYKMFFNELLS